MEGENHLETKDGPLSKNRVWLVKSSHQILGPFSLDELEERVRNRQLSILDEVTTPGMRWRYIREEPELLHLVREVRDKEASNSEVTVTTTIETRTATDTDIISEEDENSEIDISISTTGSGVSNQTSPGGNGRVRQDTPVKSYGLSSDESFSRGIGETKKWVWMGAMVAVLAIAGIFFLRVKQDQAPRPGEDFTTLLAEGIKAKNLGMKEKALSLLERAEFFQPEHAELKFHLAPLKAILEGQTLAARRNLLEAMNAPKGTDMVAEGYTAIGLTYLLEEDLDQAKSYFEKALSFKRSYLPAVLNLATIEVKEGNSKEALQLFHTASLVGSADPLVQIGPGIARLEAQRLGRNLELRHVPDAETLYRVANQRYDGKQEALVLAAATALLSGDQTLALKAIREALDWDPNMTREHLHLLLVDRQLLSWTYLATHCEAIHKALAGVPEGAALQTYCLLRAGDDEGAKRVLTQAMAEFPGAPYLKSVQVYLYHQLGREAEAAVITQSLLTEAGHLRLPHLFRAQQCELDANYDCAVKHWKALSQIDSNALEVHKGLGWNSYRVKDKALASQHVQKGLELSENYLPLLELREVMGR